MQVQHRAAVVELGEDRLERGSTSAWPRTVVFITTRWAGP